MKNKKSLVVLLIVLAIIIVAGGLWYLLKPNYTCWPYCPNVTDQDREEIKQSALNAQTTDWKTYKNEKYGIEFKYPAGWENVYINDQGDALSGEKLSSSFRKGQTLEGVQFSVIDVAKIKPDIHGKFSCIENEMGCPSYQVIKDYTIGDSRARVVNYGGEGGAQVFVDVFHGDLVYEFLTFGRDSSVIEMVAATLKFTRPLTYILGNSSIQYPSIADPVNYSGRVEFAFTRYPLTTLKHVYIRMGGLGNTIPTGTYIEINKIGWTRFETDRTVPSEINLNQNVYVREISYGFCETGCAGATLVMEATSKNAFASDEAKKFTSIFEGMMATYKYPVSN